MKHLAFSTLFALLVVTLFVSACAEKPNLTIEPIHLQGSWLTEDNGDVMLDPQTSGLKYWRGQLLSLSDASAHVSQQKQLHIITPTSARVLPKSLLMVMSEKVSNSCFADYLNAEPDLEAVAVDPRDDRVFVVVTEDATRGPGMSQACQQKYHHTGSTAYPTVLVRLQLQEDNQLLMTHVRPVRFSEGFGVGDFPNDGIEGLAFGPDGTLYLALEKDSQDKARIFSVAVSDNFWQTDEFAEVQDPQLALPEFDDGNHPINGMDYLPAPNHPGYLVAAARNDNQLWIVDLQKQKAPRVVSLQFLAPTGSADASCEAWELMDNASIEGLAVAGDTLWMVNDPWRRNYEKNIQCETNRAKYEKFAPLLFSLPIDPSWTGH